MIEQILDGEPCANPDCDNEFVEPEADGDVSYHECEVCGYAWGYKRLSETTKIDGTCAMGVPEPLRRAASAPAERQLSTAGVVSLGMPSLRRP